MRRLPWPLRRRPGDAMACREAIALVNDYLDEALSPVERALLVDHLRACAHCAEYLEQIRASIRLACHVEPGDLDPEARAAMTDLYRAWREDS